MRLSQALRRYSAAHAAGFLLAGLIGLAVLWHAQVRAEGLACDQLNPLSVVTFDVGPGRTLAGSIAEPLGGTVGEAALGQELFLTEGNCVTCHEVSSLAEQAVAGDDAATARFGNQGTVGPKLDAVAERYTGGELRLIVVDPRRAWPDRRVAMPSAHATDAGVRVAPSCIGQPILSAEQVEHVVAYLMTLRPAATSEAAQPQPQPTVPRP